MEDQNEEFRSWLFQFRKTFLCSGHSMFNYCSHSPNDHEVYLINYKLKYNIKDESTEPIQLQMW
nr:MAG: hypothetical protein [Microvirus sp.]